MEEEKPIDKKQDKKKDKKDQKEDDLSEEDKELKENIEMLCERIRDRDDKVAKQALDQLKEIVRTSTTSMTSVPKPFKFIRPYYQTIVDHYEKLPPQYFKRILADFLSVLAMTMAETGKQISLNFLKQGTMQEYKNWGHGYLQHLASEIGKEYNARVESDEGTDDLIELVNQIVPYFIENNAEADAIDLSMEVDQLQSLTQYVQKSNFLRIVEYLQKCSLYCADQEEMEKTLKTAYDISLKNEVYTCALRIAIKLDKDELISKVFEECQDHQIKKQLCFQIARQRIVIPELDEELNKIASNSMLTEFFQRFAKELDILDPKTPDQVYKSYLEEKAVSANIDSSKANLANTYVNAFVNCASKKDTLMLNQDAKEPWVFKVKGDGQVAAVGSIGMLDLWDPEEGACHINEYLETKDGYTKMGACIGVGLYCSGTTSEIDPAKALLEEFIGGKENFAKLGSIIGLGIAYAGSGREDFLDDLVALVVDNNIDTEVSAYAALSLGLIFVGKCQEEVSNAIVQTLSERNEAQLNCTVSRFFAVALGLLFLGQQEICEATLEILAVIEHPISKYAEICIEGCAYVGSGNVLKVQKMLHHCVEHLEESKSAHQQVAVLSIALIASSEEIGNDMAMRSLNHLLQYCDIGVKRAVPLAMAILNLSNPKINAMDLLLKLSHDEDTELSQRAMFAMGLIGAGTNNSRLADILRNVASYYTKESNGLFLVRLSQGLIHMGKGMLTIQPYYSDKYLLSKVGMAGIITVVHSALDMKNIILDKYHYNLFYLALSIYPKMLFTLDENLENTVVNLRVGQAVDSVGQAGKGKKITGFQTHTSPVLINFGERAELATEEYIATQESVLENFVIIKKNPDYIPEDEKPKKKNSL